MATTEEYKNYISEQLKSVGDITFKKMMGEYLLYYNGVLLGGIYDDRLLVKIVEENKKYDMDKALPYENGKEMYFVSDVDDQSALADVIKDTYKGLTNNKR